MKLSDKKAEQNLTQFRDSINKVDWHTTSAKQIYNVKNEEFVGKPVKLVGHIHSISDPMPVEENGKRLVYVPMSIKDKSNDQINVLAIYDGQLQKGLKESFQHQNLCTFHGTVLSIITKDKAGYTFYLRDFNPKVTPEDLIEVQYDLKTDRPDVFIKEIVTQKDKFKYFKNKIVDGLKIKGLDKEKNYPWPSILLSTNHFHQVPTITVQ
jgi:hypothetical protein